MKIRLGVEHYLALLVVFIGLFVVASKFTGQRVSVSDASVEAAGTLIVSM